MNGSLQVMASPAWTALMRYVSRRLRTCIRSRVMEATATVREVVVELAADVQVDLATFLARGPEVRSLYRLADRAIAKHLERHQRRQRRRGADLHDLSDRVPEPAACLADVGVEEMDTWPSIESAPGWRLLRGRREREIVLGVASGQTLVVIAGQQGMALKEVRRVAAGLTAKLAQRRGALP